MRLTRLFPLLLRRMAPAAATGAALTAGVAHATPSDDRIPGEAAVFARFSDLDDPATQQRLADLYKDPRRAATLSVISAALADPTVENAAIEGRLRELIGRATSADADRTLAAVMLDHYLGYLRDALADASLRPSDVFALMIERDALLTAAAYGPSTGPGRVITRR